LSGGRASCVDSSVAIAAFGEWHELHEPAVEALAGSPALVAHAALEAYSVLTRLPEPFRAPASTVAGYLAANFASGRLALPAAPTPASTPSTGASNCSTTASTPSSAR
jgi:hypothetical protein